MDLRLRQWKEELDAMWAVPAFDYREAARLAAAIACGAEDPVLREAAEYAAMSLRAASHKTAGRITREASRRRLGRVRDVLQALAAPRFGKRRMGPEMLTPDDQRRRILGLPLGRRLFGPEIHQAFKRAAKKAHPDAGGNEQAFQELAAARDALMKGG